MTPVFIKIENYSQLATGICHGALAVFDTASSQAEIMESMRKSGLEAATVYLENNPPKDISPGSLKWWCDNYIESYLFMVFATSTLLKKIKNPTTDNLKIGIIDCCEKEGSSWKQAILSYHLQRDIVHDGYEEKLKKIVETYGASIMDNHSVLFDTWVMPILKKKYDN